MNLTGFPAWVVIDDKCDGCGPEAKGRHGVAYGAGKPVICERCLVRGVELLDNVSSSVLPYTCLPCRCGSRDLFVHRWGLGAGATVCCNSCNAGTPAGRFEDAKALTVNSGQDATSRAVDAWNRWVKAGAQQIVVSDPVGTQKRGPGGN
jgi:hypothetical protein